jgi:hypothetical protein
MNPALFVFAGVSLYILGVLYSMHAQGGHLMERCFKDDGEPDALGQLKYNMLAPLYGVRALVHFGKWCTGCILDFLVFMLVCIVIYIDPWLK